MQHWPDAPCWRFLRASRAKFVRHMLESTFLNISGSRNSAEISGTARKAQTFRMLGVEPAEIAPQGRAFSAAQNYDLTPPNAGS
jgi:hypothetical protein